ncbi:MAG: MBL fold metallo-hydrolase [Rubrivivax sp.]|jgi:glyoxylase-like metal-dependent hydrolase (beta-lactamase superfamily II)|nr:MBL fold metallo-hydrolase [Rubrivivax sp.]
MRTPASHLAALDGLQVFERGWLSSNNVLMFDDDGQATLVDSGHVTHAAMTAALVRRALAAAPPGTRLARVVNTHLHSDHVGGNATLQRGFGAEVWIPPGHFDAVRAWDDDALTYRASGQLCERFVPQRQLAPGGMLAAGGRRWEVLAAPGHDPHSVILFDAHEGVLISADALWENGFGVVFPELEGESAFDDVGAVLDLIGRLDARVVVPGHGAPFTDIAGALQRARRRLDGFRSDRSRHTRHAAKVLLKYHLMEVREQPLAEMLAWYAATPMLRSAWAEMAGALPDATVHDWARALFAELLESGALRLDDGVVRDA